MKLIIGLGNPGLDYRGTRHNIGYEAVNQLQYIYDFPPFAPSDKFRAELSRGSIEGQNIILVKPMTFMNRSGYSVRLLRHYHKTPIEDVIVIYDDININSGMLRARPNGSAGGHNGIRSLIQELGTEDFSRIRIGTRPEAEFRGRLEDYVLGKFTNNQKEKIDSVIRTLPEVIAVILEHGIEEAMNRYN
jgi:PTH1 family peptidyl-tRNA hydrolase